MRVLIDACLPVQFKDHLPFPGMKTARKPQFVMRGGALFGIATAWFAYPYIEESMNETRQFFLKKIAVVQASD